MKKIRINSFIRNNKTIITNSHCEMAICYYQCHEYLNDQKNLMN